MYLYLLTTRTNVLSALPSEGETVVRAMASDIDDLARDPEQLDTPSIPRVGRPNRDPATLTR